MGFGAKTLPLWLRKRRGKSKIKLIEEPIASGPSGPSFNTEYNTILTRATALGYTLPSASQQIKQNDLITAMKASGAWDSLDAFWVMATDGSSDFATLNWKNPLLYQLVFTNSVFTPNKGFKPNGTDGFGETNFNPSTNGVNYTLNNASRVLHVTTAPTVGNRMEGFKTSTTSRSLYLNSTLHTINGGVISATVDLTGTTVKGIFRSTGTNVKFINDTTETDVTATVTALANETFVLGRSSTVFSNTELGMYGLGNNFASIWATFRTDYLNYYNSL